LKKHLASRRIVLWGMLAVGTAGAVLAQEEQPLAAGNEALLTLAYPVKKAATPITLDGQLSPGEWDQAVKVAGFRVSGREDLASEQTVMHLLYDDTNLYLGIKCAESRMDQLVAKCQVDDTNVWNDDCIEFFLDLKHDHANYFHFIVNSVGARYDAVGFDRTWSAPWTVKTSRAADAWYIEAAFPFAALKAAAPKPGTVWGFNLDRERQAGGSLQLYNWADVRGNFHSPKLFGHLWFVPADWQPEAQSVAEAAGRVGGEEAHIYVPGGYWVVKEGEAPRGWTYREMLKCQEGEVTRFWTELEGIYKERPQMILRDQFEKFRARYEQTRQLAAETGPVDPEACAAAKVFLDGLGEQLRTLYWKVRIEQLGETF